MTTGAEFGLAVNECQAMVPGRGGGDAKAIQAGGRQGNLIEFLMGIQ